MSDVTVVPDGGSASEVVINEQPVNIPNPVGSQTPVEERRSDPTAEGRREAIQRAFERASHPKDAKPAQRPPPKPAEAKPGHNQPPEDRDGRVSETPKL